MLNQREKNFFAAFSDFHVSESKSSIAEFCRLAETKGWDQDSDLFRSFWRACFETDAPASSKSSTTSKAVQQAPSAENGLSLIESNLRRLNLGDEDATTAITSVKVFTPTASIDGDGVIVRYFDLFLGFDGDYSAPLKIEFDRLAVQQGWVQNTEVYRYQYIRCCTDEFKYFCGDSESKLDSWQNLCIDIAGIYPPPPSKNQCRNALRGHYVNIFDYIDCKRQCKPVGPVFTTKSSFRKYTLKKASVFPKSAAKQNPLLSIMLEKLFSQRQ